MIQVITPDGIVHTVESVAEAEAIQARIATELERLTAALDAAELTSALATAERCNHLLDMARKNDVAINAATDRHYIAETKRAAQEFVEYFRS